MALLRSLAVLAFVFVTCMSAVSLLIDISVSAYVIIFTSIYYSNCSEQLLHHNKRETCIPTGIPFIMFKSFRSQIRFRLYPLLPQYGRNAFVHCSYCFINRRYLVHDRIMLLIKNCFDLRRLLVCRHFKICIGCRKCIL